MNFLTKNITLARAEMMPTQGCKDAALLQVVYLRGFEIRGPVGAIWRSSWRSSWSSWCHLGAILGPSGMSDLCVRRVCFVFFSVSEHQKCSEKPCVFFGALFLPDWGSLPNIYPILGSTGIPGIPVSGINMNSRNDGGGPLECTDVAFSVSPQGGRMTRKRLN